MGGTTGRPTEKARPRVRRETLLKMDTWTIRNRGGAGYTKQRLGLDVRPSILCATATQQQNPMSRKNKEYHPCMCATRNVACSAHVASVCCHLLRRVFLCLACLLQIIVFLVSPRFHTLVLPTPTRPHPSAHPRTLLQAQQHILKVLQDGVYLVLCEAIS